MKKSDLTINPLLINQYLPHNFLAEKIVLSSLLNSSEALDLTLNHLTIETFYFKNHQEIYKAIINMSKKNISIDILTLTTFLKDNGILEKIGGLKVLSEFLNQLPNIQYLKEYIKLIQDKFLRRTLIQLGYKIINSCYITTIPLENILNDLETEVLNLTIGNQTKNFFSSTQLFTNILFELKQKSLQPILPGLSSGFYDLDSITQGFQKSDLIIIAGRPSIGKTAFCLNITINIIKKYNLPILFFSLEMSKEQLIYRLLSSESGISNLRLRSGNILKQDWLTLNNIITSFSSLPLFIDDTANLSVTNIRKKIKKIIFEQAQIGLIVIDYLQLMQNSTHSIENRVQELGLITRSLKIIAREFKIPIITLSQLSRNVENRINKRPILADLRESGSIEQDADLVLMLYRDNYYNFVSTEFQTAELIIAKHRNGPTGTIKLKFQEKLTKFLDMDNSN
uniref:Replicative DNA helicase n=1 Tax=Coscinodiscus radiatus TaxID=33642 RepID=A0A023HBL1_9STRA|nr:replication helicase subunit [Coscinodiscus radiatus]AGH28428.1 replication helicase subunit [Coscinodiscus radiatus]